MFFAALLVFVGAGSPCTGLGRHAQRPLSLQVPRTASLRWGVMCEDEQTTTARMLERWIGARRDVMLSMPTGDGAPSAKSVSQMAVGEGGAAKAPCRVEIADSLSAEEKRLELIGTARAEVDCPEEFMQAVMVHGNTLIESELLHTFDIMHEVIRAETGYRLAKINGMPVDESLFDEFMEFQAKLAQVLQGWKLWEYELTHWRYHKRPLKEDDYAQLYNSHRLPEFQHVECPAVPLAYRMWSNFPTCPPTRLSEIPRFTDAYISGMTVDNWRSSYRDFLSEDYNYNTSFLSGGDPTYRLSKGAHSIFAGVFLQKLPTDLWCYQQVIHDSRPQYIIDLGSSQGGSAVWFASMLKLFEIPHGKVISVDLSLEQAYWLSDRRARDAAQRLKLEERIDWNYVVGGSKNEAVRQKVERLCASAPCMVVSDSDHDYEHTYFEMEWYAKQVGLGQYLVVEDTNIYGWNGWLNINDPNKDGRNKGPMEAANDFEFAHRADFVRTDWCAKQYGLSQTPNGWFFRKAVRARGLS